MRQASMRPESGHIQTDFLALVPARDYKVETSPHNRSSVRAEREVKRSAYCSVVKASVTWLITGSKFRGHAERRLQHATGPDDLNSFLILKSPLLMMVSETPAWFNAKERTAVGPQGQIRHSR